MNLYMSIATRIGSPEAQALAARVAAWHDAMVAHDRRRAGRFGECDDECPHEEARLLWTEAVSIFGDSAPACEFLRYHGEVGSSLTSPIAGENEALWPARHFGQDHRRLPASDQGSR
jgi:hypothetical protein